MVELLVGMAMGMVVLAGLAMLLIVTVRGNARVDARAEATDNARVAMTRIMEELHSGCVTAATAPVQPGSGPLKLIFKHGTYGQQSGGQQATLEEPPTTTEIVYEGNHTLKEINRTTGERRTLLTHVSPGSNNKIFKYFNASYSPSSFEAAELGSPEARATILVSVAFRAAPKSEPVADAGAAAEIRNSATLRLTPPLYSSNQKAMPCQ